MKQPLVTNIQKYSIHDGNGIRTTIFFKGCPLTCTWCHNPETQSYIPQMLSQPERCGGCGLCVAACPNDAISVKDGVAITDYQKCNGCQTCVDECLLNLRELSGKAYTVAELVREAEKDRVFYEQSGGGVTLSGGEVLAMDMDYIEKLMKELTGRGISVNIDTCGAIPWSAIQRIVPYTDTFLYDLKIMDEQLHKRHAGLSNQNILDNLRRLARIHEKIWIRIPVIGGVNDTLENMEETVSFLKSNDIRAEQIYLLPYHNTGSSKYQRLQRNYEGVDFQIPLKEKLEELSQIFIQSGYSTVKIGG